MQKNKLLIGIIGAIVVTSASAVAILRNIDKITIIKIEPPKYGL